MADPKKMISAEVADIDKALDEIQRLQRIIDHDKQVISEIGKIGTRPTISHGSKTPNPHPHLKILQR